MRVNRIPGCSSAPRLRKVAVRTSAEGLCPGAKRLAHFRQLTLEVGKGGRKRSGHGPAVSTAITDTDADAEGSDHLLQTVRAQLEAVVLELRADRPGSASRRRWDRRHARTKTARLPMAV